MSCKFCTDGVNGWWHEPIADTPYIYAEIISSYGQIEVNSFYEREGDLTDHPTGECVRFIENIKFCPMCGREL